MNVVIIGASFAGIAAAIGIRQKYKEASVQLLDKQADIGFLPGGLNLWADGQVEQLQEARYITPEQLRQQGIDLCLAAEVTAVDTVLHYLKYEKEGTEFQIAFDKLVLATGSSQWSRQIPGSNSSKVLKYKFLEGSSHSLDVLADSQSVAVIGGGQIGGEAIDSLLKLKKDIHLFESMDYLLFKYFDQEMILPVQEDMKQAGVHFHFNETVEEIVEQGQLSIKTRKGDYQCDGAVFAMNVRPDLAYLDRRVERHMDGTILVDNYLQTSQKDVFAVGDCIQIRHSLDTESVYIPLVNNAVRTGLTVAENLIDPAVEFTGSLRTIGTKLGEYYIGSTGLTEAESLFYPEEVAAVHLTQKAALFSEEMISGKLIFEKSTKKLLGAQLVSKVDILEKINTLALSIQVGQTLVELYQKDYLFHPFFTNILDITNHLGVAGLWSEQHED
ncbi:FAD-dependent oxidoreductase [Enterococcus sp. LJL128]